MGEPDEKSFGPPDVAEPIHVFVPDHFVDEMRAVLPEPGKRIVEIAMMRTPDGHSRLELSRFLTPPAVADHRNAPVNALGYLRVMFAVDDIDETLARLRKRGAQLVGEVVKYKDVYRLCYIRGPEGLLIGLAQELG